LTWFVIVSGVIAGRAEAATFPYPIATRTLDNGLRVYVVPMNGSPGVAAFGTWMSIGSRNEVESGKTGFAHFFEHLMFHGTPTLSGADRDRELLRLGADDNAWTWTDETVYHTLIPSAALPRVIEIEGDRFQHLKLVEDPLRREAGAVYGEFRKGQADPDTVLYDKLVDAAFTIHPYRHDTLGYEADIAAMPSRYPDALAFFDRYYRPENAAVVVTGDVDPAQVFAWVEQRYGTWTRGTQPPAPIPAEPPQRGLRRVHVDWPGDTAGRLTMAWKVPAQTDPRSPALELAADLLLADTGPLVQRLVRQEGLAYSVSGGRDSSVDPGLLTISVEARDPAALDRIEAEIREEVGKLAAGVDPTALDALRTRLRYRFLSSLDDPMTVLNVVGQALRRDPDPAALDRWQDALAATTADQVAAEVRATLIDDGLTVATLTPTGAK
jgi:zinc protease